MSDDVFSSGAAGAPGDLRERGRMASTLGTLSVVLCLLLPCASCLALMGAVPLSLVAIQMGRSVLAAHPDEVAEVQARHGVTTGMIALIYSSVLLMLFFAYMSLYVFVLALAVAGNL